MNRGKLFVLLLLSIVPLLSASPTLGQGYTTVTAQSTVTSLLSQTFSQLLPVSSYATTSTFQEAIITATWTNTGEGISYCYTTSESFSATRGQTVEGTVTANIPASMIVYILSDPQYNAWRSTDKCDPNDALGSMWQLGVFRNFITQASVDWSPEESGTYWLLAQTYSATPVVVTVNLNWQVAAPTTITLYSTSFSTYAQSVTQTLTSATIQELAQPQTNTGQASMGVSATFPLLIGFVIIAIILLGYLVVKRKKR